MNSARYMLRYLRAFRFGNIRRYIERIPVYRDKMRRAKKFEDITSLERDGGKYAVVPGGEENYIFSIKDRLIPQTIYIEGETFSQGDIEMFFRLTEKYYGYTPEDCAEGMFLDIGANIGTTSIFVARHMCSRMKVISFEPDEENFRLLKANTVINQCENVTCENIALSDKAGIAKMKISTENRGANRIVDGLEEKSTEEIRTDSLDGFFSNTDYDEIQIKYIWMDTEGHEPYVLKGMDRVLKSHRIPIYMEFSGNIMSDKEFAMLYGILSRYYDGFIAFENGKKAGKKFEIEKLQALYRREKSQQYDLFLF